ncbi:FixH family protein [Marinicella sp. W31]|uniref:FixH family protein n=1 Tax=Marinicella sp. W31 TaxID=3023713 RepID=UPI003756B8FA
MRKTAQQNRPELHLDDKPWYKQFWPWFVFALPACSVIAGITTVVIATRNADTVVVDDYYKQGLAINQRMDKQNQARDLGIRAELKYDQAIVSLQISSETTEFQQLTLSFRHATQAHKDFSLQLKQRPDGSYFAAVPQDLSGKWQVSLQPQHQQWELVNTWILPNTSVLILA